MKSPLVILLYIAVGATTAHAQLRVEPHKENVVAGRLEGAWELDGELTKRLGGGFVVAIAFKSDPMIAGKIPAKYNQFLGDKRIYLAGIMTLEKKDYPFLLIALNGNPHVVYFRERDGDPLGDGESFNIMLAPARDRENDLLLMGGDFNNQPFTALRRKQAEKQ